MVTFDHPDQAQPVSYAVSTTNTTTTTHAAGANTTSEQQMPFVTHGQTQHTSEASMDIFAPTTPAAGARNIVGQPNTAAPLGQKQPVSVDTNRATTSTGASGGF